MIVLVEDKLDDFLRHYSSRYRDWAYKKDLQALSDFRTAMRRAAWDCKMNH